MSLNSRRDNRTTEEFAADLKRYAKEESIIAECIRLHLEELYEYCKVVDIGVDSSGLLISGNLPNQNVDREYHLKNKILKVEIKTAPHNRFLTFKVSSLKAALLQDAYIVIVIKSQKNGFFLLTKAGIESIMEKEHKIYPAFSPNDISVRVYNNEFDKFFQFKEWTPKALEYIKQLC